jgi:CBS domain-containing protein
VSEQKQGKFMKIRDILTKDPHVVRPDAMISEAAKMMKQYDIGMLPVCDGQRLVGSVTDRDLAIRAIADGRNPLSTKVSDIMTPKVSWCYDDQELEDAAQVMEQKQIRRLPIVNREKQLVGIVSLGDFALRSQNNRLAEEVLECVSQPA